MIDPIWSTQNEINFLKQAMPFEGSKLQFLLNYKEAITHRTHWGAIDKSKLLSSLNKQIKTLKGDQSWQD